MVSIIVGIGLFSAGCYVGHVVREARSTLDRIMAQALQVDSQRG